MNDSIISFIKEEIYDEENKYGSPNYTRIASKVLERYDNLQIAHRTLRGKVSDIYNEQKEQEQENYNRSENIVQENSEQSIQGPTWEQWKKIHNIREEDVKNVKAWTMSNGTQTYSVLFKKGSGQDSEKYDFVLEELIEHFKNRDIKLPESEKNPKIGVTPVTDIHIGAYVRNLIKTPDYDVETSIKALDDVAKAINEENYSEVHLPLLGDLIESFTGKNHKDNFKEIQQGYTGSKLVIAASEIVFDFLSKINNLKAVYFIPGNHDRYSESTDDDAEGEICHLIYYIVKSKLEGVEVTYDRYIKSIEIDGINYVMTHGHHNLTKANIESLVWKYGKQGIYNVGLSGHLHNRGAKKKTSNENILYDGDDCRWYVCPSIFPGNFYSERANFSGLSGFYHITNKNNLPRVIDEPIWLR